MFEVVASKNGVAELGAEILGEACGAKYKTKEEAQAVADRLTSARWEYPVLDGVEYEVVELSWRWQGVEDEAEET